MSFHVRDPETDALVRELARARGVGLTEAIKLATRAELERGRAMPSFLDEVRKLQSEIASRRRPGVVIDKAFFDELSGQGDD